MGLSSRWWVEQGFGDWCIVVYAVFRLNGLIMCFFVWTLSHPDQRYASIMMVKSHSLGLLGLLPK